MPFPGSPYRATASVAVRPRGHGVVFAVGRRVFVACSAAATPSVTLTDDLGTTSHGRLRDGAEVEIVAWRPHGPLGTRYLVRSSSRGVEGWLGAADLRGSRVRAAKVAVPSSGGRVAR
jgi:hypothetical protein